MNAAEELATHLRRDRKHREKQIRHYCWLKGLTTGWTGSWIGIAVPLTGKPGSWLIFVLWTVSIFGLGFAAWCWIDRKIEDLER